MEPMEVPTGVEVECLDGPCGRAKYVILDPATAVVTHVVVGGPAELAETRLVPISGVAESTREFIRLKYTKEELQSLPLFSQYEYAKGHEAYTTYMAPELWMGSLTPYMPIVSPEEHRYIPSGELPIQRGSRVIATDGPVGRVDELTVEPASGRITHFVLRTGHLWDRRQLAIPVALIDRIESDAVYLNISRQSVDELPTLQFPSEAQEIRSNRVSIPAPTEGQERIEDLVADLASTSRLQREAARRSLVEIGPPAVDALTWALARNVGWARWEAAKALQQIASPSTAPAMMSILEDRDPGLRWIAAEGLAGLGRDGVIPLLEALEAKPDSAWLRSGAHHVFRLLTDAEIRKEIAPVMAALDDVEPSLTVPVTAHRALRALR